MFEVPQNLEMLYTFGEMTLHSLKLDQMFPDLITINISRLVGQVSKPNWSGSAPQTVVFGIVSPVRHLWLHFSRHLS